MGSVLTDWLREVWRTVLVLVLSVACVAALALGARALYHLAWAAPLEQNLLAMRPAGLERAVLHDWNLDWAPGPGGHESGLAVFRVDNLSARGLAAAGWRAGQRRGAEARDWVQKKGNPPFPDGVGADWEAEFWLEWDTILYLADVTSGRVLMAFHD